MPEYSVNITAEMAEKANSYVPVSEKQMVSRAVAFFCCEAVQPDTPTSMKELPKLTMMVQENRKLRQQFQMGLLADYLGCKYPVEAAVIPGENGESVEQPLPHCMAEEEYDRWASSHVMNQMERLKKSKESGVADKVFDILYDYKNYENMISAAIRDYMEQMNDSFNRVAEYISLFATEEVSQAVMKSLMQSKEEVQEALNEVEEYKKKKGEADG